MTDSENTPEGQGELYSIEMRLLKTLRSVANKASRQIYMEARKSSAASDSREIVSNILVGAFSTIAKEVEK
mgnify:CR=1 FL=1